MNINAAGRDYIQKRYAGSDNKKEKKKKDKTNDIRDRTLNKWTRTGVEEQM